MKQQLRIMLLILAMIAGGASSELHAIDGVSYLDNDGTVKTRDDVTELYSQTDFRNLVPGWYVVTNNIVYDNIRIEVSAPTGYENGDVHIIIKNGVTIDITDYGIEITNPNGNVYFHAESNTGTPGKIIAITSGCDHAIFAHCDITFNGLNVEAESTIDLDGISSDRNITVNGGSITAIGESHGIICNGFFTMNGCTVDARGIFYGICAFGGVVFNGGNFTANGTEDGGIDGNVTLKWTSPDDSFTANGISDLFTVTIAGGYAFTDGTVIYQSDIYDGSVFSNDFTLTPVYKISVTSLNSSGDEVTEFYNTLTDAFNAAKTAYVPGNGSDVAEFIPTVTLLADVTGLTSGYTIGDGTTTTKVTLDLNDHTITGAVDGTLILVTKNAELEIVDNGTDTGTKGTITNNYNGTRNAIGVDGGGTLTASGVRIDGDKGYAIYNWGTADVNGCELSGKWGIFTNGTTTVSGTSISGTDCGISVYDGTTTIGSGVSISGYSHSGIYYYDGTVILKALPTFKDQGNGYMADIYIWGGHSLTFGEGTFSAENPKIKLYLRDNNGYHVNPVTYTNAITEGYAANVKLDGIVIDPNEVFVWHDTSMSVGFGLTDAGEVIFCPGVASVTAYNGGSTPTINYYATLHDALIAAKSAFDNYSGSTPAVVPKVTLFDDVTDITSSIRLSGRYNCDLVLDLNGHKLSGDAGPLIYVVEGRTLTVEDSGEGGRIVNTGNHAIRNFGTTNLHGVTIGGRVTSIENRGTMNVSGGTIDMSGAVYGIGNFGTLTLNGLPKFEHGTYGLQADIMLGNDNIITFGAGTYEAPENPIIVDCENDLPYTFTEGYSENVLDKYGYVIDPYRVFSYVGGTSDYQVTFDELDGEATIYHGAADVVLANDADNSKKLVMGKYCNVTLTGRTITKDGTWNTLCLPFDVTLSGSPLQGFTVKELNASTSSLDDNGLLTINFTAVTDKIVAGKPYILKWEGESAAALTETNLVFPNVTITSTEPEAVTFSNDNGAPCQFVGQYSPFEINDGTATEGFHSNVNNIDEILFLATTTATHSTVLGYSQSPRRLRACRTHFWVPARQTAGGEPVSPVRSFVLDFGDGTDATGVVELKNSRIEELNSDDGWYSMDGRRLPGKPAQKGVYIHQGRKIVVR